MFDECLHAIVGARGSIFPAHSVHYYVGVRRRCVGVQLVGLHTCRLIHTQLRTEMCHLTTRKRWKGGCSPRVRLTEGERIWMVKGMDRPDGEERKHINGTTFMTMEPNNI
jgi:hypothetical protein